MTCTESHKKIFASLVEEDSFITTIIHPTMHSKQFILILTGNLGSLKEYQTVVGDLSNQREFFENLKKKLNILTDDDWYKITYKGICNYGGGGLLKRYSDSPYNALKSIYPRID